MEGHPLWGSQRTGTLPITHEQNFVHTEAQTSGTGVDFLRGAELEAQNDDVSLGTNTQEDHVILLRQFFIVSQENHLRNKPGKCEFMKEEIEHLGFDVGYRCRNQPRLRCSPCRTCRFAVTLRRVYTT